MFKLKRVSGCSRITLSLLSAISSLSIGEQFLYAKSSVTGFIDGYKIDSNTGTLTVFPAPFYVILFIE